MMYIYYMSIAVILCAILLCLSKILKQEVDENEESEQKSLGGSGKGSKAWGGTKEKNLATILYRDFPSA